VSLRQEILEQPAVAARLVHDGAPEIGRIRGAIARFAPAFVVIAARGSSDHAAIYAQYVFGVFWRLPVALATPSLLSLYGADPRVERALVVGISQSGVSPDVVGVVAAARRQGALTIALTNDPGSALAVAAEHVIDLRAGEERSVAATKTYTAELLALAMLAGVPAADLDAVPDALTAALGAEPEARGAAGSLAAMQTATVLAPPGNGRSSSRSSRTSSPTRTRPPTSSTGRSP
jgi:glucosamine--fructose-6-phosphate aminotransferase (isomerizing)